MVAEFGSISFLSPTLSELQQARWALSQIREPDSENSGSENSQFKISQVFGCRNGFPRIAQSVRSLTP